MLLDRIDIQVEVDSVPVSEIRGADASESSAAVRERVSQAREIQAKRYEGTKVHCNAQLDNRGIETYCRMAKDAENLLHKAVERMNLSMRAYHRVMKVARTVADLRGAKDVGVADVAEAIQFRELDQKYWGA
ncbi:MAG: ATP-binding protein [Clostridia bacterium]|nr:ATP-binding protein [Clostridia bacterium]